MALNVAISDVTPPKHWITTDGLWWSCSRKIQCLLKPEIFLKVRFDSILGSNHYDQVFHLHGTPSRYLPLLRDRWQCLHKQGWPAHWRMSGISEPYTLKANNVLRSLYTDSQSQCCRDVQQKVPPPTHPAETWTTWAPPSITGHRPWNKLLNLLTPRFRHLWKWGQELCWAQRAVRTKWLTTCNSFHPHMMSLPWILAGIMILCHCILVSGSLRAKS